MTLYPTAHQRFWCIFRSVARESSIAPTTSNGSLFIRTTSALSIATSVTNQGVKTAPSNTLSSIYTASQKVVAEIVTGAGAHGVVVSRGGERVFVANSFANTLSIIGPVNRIVLKNIAVGDGPGGIIYYSDK